MMDDLSRTLHHIQDGPVSRLLLADILRLAEGEGILERVEKLSPCSVEKLCAVLQSELGYALDKGNRRRMICLLLDLLRETGQVREVGGRWRWCEGEEAQRRGGAGEWGSARTAGSGQLAEDDQYLFFRRCLASVPAYLRGGAPSLRFDSWDTGTWERFLGCAEFRSCRSLLLEFLGIDAHPAPRLLDLCHGPGWGVEAVLSRFPAARVTALDFTESFRERAQTRADRVQERSRCDGQPVNPIIWVGPDRWKGFGHPLPFAASSFEVVFFSCGDPYIPHHVRRKVYQDVARVLMPGGRLGVLTRCRPDAAGRHVPSFWLRIAALAHDFAESVCEGWAGFAEAEENARVFAAAGFCGGVALSNSMSVLDSSLWVLKKARTHA